MSAGGTSTSGRRLILVDQKAYVGTVFAILAYVIIAIVIVIRRKHIEPAGAPVRVP